MKSNSPSRSFWTGILILCCTSSLRAAILTWSVEGTYSGAGILEGTYVATSLGANAYSVTSISGLMNGSAINAGPTSYAGAQLDGFDPVVFDSVSWVGGYLNGDLAFSTEAEGSWKFDRTDPNTGIQTFSYAQSSLYGGLNERFIITGYVASVPEASHFGFCAGLLALLSLGAQGRRRGGSYHRLIIQPAVTIPSPRFPTLSGF